MVKLIATDIDGTLLKEAQMNINPEYFQVIEKLVEQGIVFVAASGRVEDSVAKLLAPVRDKIWIISQNGGVISDQNGNTDVPNPVSTEWAREFWDDFSRYDQVECCVGTADATYCSYEGTPIYDILKNGYHYDVKTFAGKWEADGENELIGQTDMDKYPFPPILPSSVLPEGKYSMLSIYHPDINAFQKQEPEICRKWAERACFVQSGEFWLNASMHGTSKGNAVKFICQKLGIDLEDTITFGDNMNDISMIEAAGVGYAVKTALDPVKDAADFVIPSFDEDGVLEVLKQLL